MYGYQCVFLLLKHILFIIYIFNNNTKYCSDIFFTVSGVPANIARTDKVPAKVILISRVSM